MEFLMDEEEDPFGSSLVNESGDSGTQCSNCLRLQQDVKRLKDDYAQNFGKLKQKVIATDLLIKKYKTKCEDYDNQSRKLEDTAKKLESLQRQNETIGMQLKSSLLETEPLKKMKLSLEAENRLKLTEIQDLTDKLHAAQSSCRQFDTLSKTSTEECEKLQEEKEELQKRLHSLENKNPKQASQIKDLKAEVKTLKLDNSVLSRSNKKLEKKLEEALATVDSLKNQNGNNYGIGGRKLNRQGESALTPRRLGSVAKKGAKAPMLKNHHTFPASLDEDDFGFDENEDEEEKEEEVDDSDSLSSFPWTFSPLMKCLSPLPPSPAGVNKGQTHGIDLQSSSDEEVLSDIATELENQLISEDVVMDTDGVTAVAMDTCGFINKSEDKPVTGNQEDGEHSVQDLADFDQTSDKDKSSESKSTVKTKLRNSLVILSPKQIKKNKLPFENLKSPGQNKKISSRESSNGSKKVKSDSKWEEPKTSEAKSVTMETKEESSISEKNKTTGPSLVRTDTDEFVPSFAENGRLKSLSSFDSESSHCSAFKRVTKEGTVDIDPKINENAVKLENGENVDVNKNLNEDKHSVRRSLRRQRALSETDHVFENSSIPTQLQTTLRVDGILSPGCQKRLNRSSTVPDKWESDVGEPTQIKNSEKLQNISNTSEIKTESSSSTCSDSISTSQHLNCDILICENVTDTKQGEHGKKKEVPNEIPTECGSLKDSEDVSGAANKTILKLSKDFSTSADETNIELLPGNKETVDQSEGIGKIVDQSDGSGKIVDQSDTTTERTSDNQGLQENSVKKKVPEALPFGLVGDTSHSQAMNESLSGDSNHGNLSDVESELFPQTPSRQISTGFTYNSPTADLNKSEHVGKLSSLVEISPEVKGICKENSKEENVEDHSREGTLSQLFPIQSNKTELKLEPNIENEGKAPVVSEILEFKSSTTNYAKTEKDENSCTSGIVGPHNIGHSCSDRSISSGHSPEVQEVEPNVSMKSGTCTDGSGDSKIPSQKKQDLLDSVKDTGSESILITSVPVIQTSLIVAEQQKLPDEAVQVRNETESQSTSASENHCRQNAHEAKLEISENSLSSLEVANLTVTSTTVVATVSMDIHTSPEIPSVTMVTRESQSTSPIEPMSPLSPLPISPFEFIIPISPLPPSPAPNPRALSPLPNSPEMEARMDTEEDRSKPGTGLETVSTYHIKKKRIARTVTLDKKVDSGDQPCVFHSKIPSDVMRPKPRTSRQKSGNLDDGTSVDIYGESSKSAVKTRAEKASAGESQIRKRKSMETSVLQESTEKKTCKEQTFKRRSKVEPDETDELAKKVQSYLKSKVLPETFVSKVNLATDRHENATKSIVSSCIQCLGRYKSDMLDAVYVSCNHDNHLVTKEKWPYLASIEKKAAMLFLYLLEQTTVSTISRDTMMSQIWSAIFSKELPVNIAGKKSLCRLYTVLCMEHGELEQARVMFYNIMTCGYMNIVSFVLPVASVWPRVLSKETGSPGILLVFEDIVMRSLQSQENENCRKVSLCIQKLCHWADVADDSTTALLKTLLKKLEEATEEKSITKCCIFELEKAIELLSHHEGWAWFKEEFVFRHALQTLANKWASKGVSCGLSSHYACCIIRITSRVICTSASVSAKDIGGILRNWVMQILRSESGCPIVRRCCIECMIEISPQYPSILCTLQGWHNSGKISDKIPPDLVAKLEELRQLYADRCGLVCAGFRKQRAR